MQRLGRAFLAALICLGLGSSAAGAAHFAADGFFVLRRLSRWRVVYVGSDLPPCSRHFPRDLIDCKP